jgi:hypothetical protein
MSDENIGGNGANGLQEMLKRTIGRRSSSCQRCRRTRRRCSSSMRRTIDDLHSRFRSAYDRKSGRSGRYRPFVDVRTILTGVSSRISTTSLLPDEAAAWARAVRDKDDDFRSRSPPNIDWLNILYLRSGSGCLLTFNRVLRLRRVVLFLSGSSWREQPVQ